MAVQWADRVRVNTSTTGTGTISLGSAVSGFRTFAAAVTADASLRARFNLLIDGVSIVELPAEFSTLDAGEAGRQLVKHVRATIA